MFLLGLARIREYPKEPCGTFILRQCLPYFFSPRCVFVGTLVREYTDTPMHLPAHIYFTDFGMPSSHLFEVTIDTAGASTSRRVSKLSRRYRRQRRESSGVMDSRPSVAAGPGPGRVRGSSSKKSLPPPRDSPPRGAKSIAFERIHAAVRPSLSRPHSAEAAARTPSCDEAASRTQ